MYVLKTQNLKFMINYKIFKQTLLMLFLGLVVSCSSDDDVPNENPEEEGYNTDVYITDAPIDNAEVEGVFVTIAEVQVNGKALEGFQKTTIELSSLTNGESELLGNVDLEAGTTSSIVLVLDNESDASGEAPGAYVLTAGGEKKMLSNTTNQISINDDAEIIATNDNQLILDFDLRKTIVMDSNGEYSFVNESRVANSIRTVNSLNAGTITGKVSNMESHDSDKMVVFAYENGSFTESEKNTDDNGVRFSNAVTSSAISDSNGDFSLHFMEEGDYELHLVSFSDDNNDGKLELEGELEVTTSAGIDLNNISVAANETASVEILLSGLLGL